MAWRDFINPGRKYIASFVFLMIIIVLTVRFITGSVFIQGDLWGSLLYLLIVVVVFYAVFCWLVFAWKRLTLVVKK
ncbi:MAG: hypothetical protein ABIH41_00750 [Nanoarchaeota archaeon]